MTNATQATNHGETKMKPELTGEVFLGSPAIRQTPGRFGIEIEMIYGTMATQSREAVAQALRAAGIAAYAEEYNHRTSSAWKVVVDGSVSFGCEVVSPILTGEAGIEELRRVCAALNAAGASVDKSTGLHLHLDTAGWQVEDFRRVLKAFCANERGIDFLVAPSRRGSANRYCKSVLARIGGASLSEYDANALIAGADPLPLIKRAYERLDACRTIGDFRSLLNYDRYHKLNLESLDRHTTIEFRQHQGSLNAEKITAWVRLLTGLSLKARSSRGLKTQKTDRTGLSASIFRLNRMSGGGAAEYRWMVARANELKKAEGWVAKRRRPAMAL